MYIYTHVNNKPNWITSKCVISFQILIMASLPASSSIVAGTSAAEEDSKKDTPTNKASEADPNKDLLAPVPRQIGTRMLLPTRRQRQTRTRM